MTNPMREINSVLLTVQWPEKHIRTLEEALGAKEVIRCLPSDDQAIRDALKRVDVAILAADLDDRFAAAPNLAWVHCDHAGLNASARPWTFERDLLVTGSAGRAAPALAQHIFYFALALTYDARALITDQANHDWGPSPRYPERRGLYGKTIGIIGLGETGRATAQLAKAFGMKVLAYGKAPISSSSDVDTYFSSSKDEKIDEILVQSDVVALSLRLTDDTYRLIGAREFSLMKRTAILVNMSRGAIVDEEAMVSALKDGVIAGVGTDVFEIEPLPASSPIWEAPNLLMTPHATCEMPDLAACSLEIILDNVGRFRRHETMRNRMKIKDTYSR